MTPFHESEYRRPGNAGVDGVYTRAKIEPYMIPDEIGHVVRLRCTSNDLLILAELAADHPTAEVKTTPFWKIRLREIVVEFVLDRDREILERGAAHRRHAENAKNGKADHEIHE